MPSRFDMPQGPQPPSPEQSVDTTRRYDVYCTEFGTGVVVYRNVLFKGVRALFGTGQFDMAARFIELEQKNGQRVFVSQHAIARFCEHGAEVAVEVVCPK